jgi:nitrile hydratase subunit beta
MNGVHDMGGMHGMGPIQCERNEPVFHEPGEARIFALNRAMSAWRKWNTDASRHAVELIPAPEYLRMGYYEQRLHSLVELMIKSGLVTRTEVENGKPASGSPRTTPALTAGAVPGMLAKGKPASRRRTGSGSLQGGPGRTRPQHPSDWSHATTALRARQAWHNPSGPWRPRLPGHQCRFPRRESATPVLGAVRGA